MSLGTARKWSWARQPSRIPASVGDSKQHLFHSHHKVGVESEAQISKVTCCRSHSLKILNSGEVYSAGLFRWQRRILRYLYLPKFLFLFFSPHNSTLICDWVNNENVFKICFFQKMYLESCLSTCTILIIDLDVFIIQMRKWRIPEVKWPAQGHMASEWLSAFKKYELTHAWWMMLNFLGTQRKLVKALVSQLGRWEFTTFPPPIRRRPVTRKGNDGGLSHLIPES